ncbi:helix-turn-helix transcriptional regulator [Fodinicurvata halophila]|uniref:Helix-turn-helix transcriptional regulator n=1 Tax=Fodinicurvata halophila TaxID=1419723 RepID=A0ABV8UJF9_9PROT
MRYEMALTLIGQIYDAVLEPTALPDALVDLSKAVGCVQECYFSEAPRHDSFSMVAPRRDPAFVKSFQDYWADRERGWELLRAGLLAAPCAETRDIRQMVAPDDFGCSEFFNTWCRPQGIGQASLVVKFSIQDGSWGICGVHKPSYKDDFDPDEIALFRMVAPHLVRMVSIQDELGSLALEAELALTRHNQNKGIILVDAARRVLFANHYAETLFGEGGAFRLESGSLTASDPNAAATLEHLVTSCAEPLPGKLDPGGAVTIAHRAGGMPVTAEVLPFGTKTARYGCSFLGMIRPVAVLVITDPEQDREHFKENLRQRFDLTPAEATLALEILKGDGRKAAADRLGISPSTVRTHLMRVFAKTGVQRQAELVRLLAADDGHVDQIGAFRG